MSEKSRSSKRHHTKDRPTGSKYKSHGLSQRIKEYDEPEICGNENDESYDTTLGDRYDTGNRHLTSPVAPFDSLQPEYTAVYQNPKYPTYPNTSINSTADNQSNCNDSVNIGGYEGGRTLYYDPGEDPTYYSGPPGTGTKYKGGSDNQAPGAFGFGGSYSVMIPQPQIAYRPAPDTNSWNCAGPQTHWNENNTPYGGRYKCFFCAWGRQGF